MGLLKTREKGKRKVLKKNKEKGKKKQKRINAMTNYQTSSISITILNNLNPFTPTQSKQQHEKHQQTKDTNKNNTICNILPVQTMKEAVEEVKMSLNDC